MKKDSIIFVAGSTGLTGSAVCRELERKGYQHVITDRVDLTSKYEINSLFTEIYPEYVFNCAAHAGGIMEAIGKPAEMIYDNNMIQTNIIHASYIYGVKKLLNLGSSCIYPVDGEQPYKEEQLGDGKTDENWSYAIAKIAAIEMCRAYYRQYGCNFISAIPCNLYGPNDNFRDNGHVIPMLIRKYHECKFQKGSVVKVWGDGRARREFLHSDDFAECAVWLMETWDYEDLYDGIVNIGSGEDTTINNLSAIISIAVGSYPFVKQEFDKPNGVPSKLMDSTIVNHLGWKPKISLEDGVKQTYEHYISTFN
jgi:GDP-L-fucose synthase